MSLASLDPVGAALNQVTMGLALRRRKCDTAIHGLSSGSVDVHNPFSEASQTFLQDHLTTRSAEAEEQFSLNQTLTSSTLRLPARCPPSKPSTQDEWMTVNKV